MAAVFQHNDSFIRFGESVVCIDDVIVVEIISAEDAIVTLVKSAAACVPWLAKRYEGGDEDDNDRDSVFMYITIKTGGSTRDTEKWYLPSTVANEVMSVLRKAHEFASALHAAPSETFQLYVRKDLFAGLTHSYDPGRMGVGVVYIRSDGGHCMRVPLERSVTAEFASELCAAMAA